MPIVLTLEDITRFEGLKFQDISRLGGRKVIGFIPISAIIKEQAHIPAMLQDLQTKGIHFFIVASPFEGENRDTTPPLTDEAQIIEELGDPQQCLRYTAAGRAIYAYEPLALSALLAAHAPMLETAGWKKPDQDMAPDIFALRIATEWVPPSNPVHKLVERVFGNPEYALTGDEAQQEADYFVLYYKIFLATGNQGYRPGQFYIYTRLGQETYQLYREGVIALREQVLPELSHEEKLSFPPMEPDLSDPLVMMETLRGMMSRR
ncbi:MAG: hypothetical protein J0L97_01615 [Alphaproteobacteria bacterium]|nr:hypothetical protein [Alphaproteobacteria bacterium]